MDSVRSMLLRRTRRWINEGTFTQTASPYSVGESAVYEQHLNIGEGPRHIVRHITSLWLAPASIDRIMCVAKVVDEDRQCRNRVLSPQADDGRWGQAEIKAGPGRAGQRAFWDGEGVWVWELDPLQVDAMHRWQSQRCQAHWPGTTPDAVPTQWTHLEPLWHSEHFTLLRPPDPPKTAESGNPLLDMIATGPKRTAYASPDCRNGSVAPVPEGWLCYKCAPRATRRARTHRAYQSPSPSPADAPGFADAAGPADDVSPERPDTDSQEATDNKL